MEPSELSYLELAETTRGARVDTVSCGAPKDGLAVTLSELGEDARLRSGTGPANSGMEILLEMAVLVADEIFA